MFVNPISINNSNNYRKNCSFGIKAPIDSAERILIENKKQSAFFKPFTALYDRMTDNIAKNFTSKVIEWSPLIKLADKFKNSKNLFQHCLTVGSAITSGLYMQRTYTNKNMDRDRRNTLVVNQGLTFLVSTAGAYGLDKYVKGGWDNITARFAGHLMNDADFYNNFKEQKANAVKLLKEAKKNKNKIDIKLPDVTKMVKSHNNFKALKAEDAKYTLNLLKGMRLLRTMIVFGFIYRFFVPVAVTKPANKLCEMYLEHKKKKDNSKVLEK